MLSYLWYSGEQYMATITLLFLVKCIESHFQRKGFSDTLLILCTLSVHKINSVSEKLFFFFQYET